MRRSIALLAAAASLGACTTALADSAGAAAPTPSQGCKSQRAQMGRATFDATYGTGRTKANAFGKCVSRTAKAQAKDQRSAQAQCTAEEANPAFASAHGGDTFDQFYGTGKKSKNAFRTCVSTKRTAAAKAHTATIVNAARQCKNERAANPGAFKTAYGTGKTKANAFGKCVSKIASA